MAQSSLVCKSSILPSGSRHDFRHLLLGALFHLLQHFLACLSKPALDRISSHSVDDVMILDTSCCVPLPTCTPPPAAWSWPANLNPRLTESHLFLWKTQKTALAGRVPFSLHQLLHQVLELPEKKKARNQTCVFSFELSPHNLKDSCQLPFANYPAAASSWPASESRLATESWGPFRNTA
jgi:hypothetical protein